MCHALNLSSAENLDGFVKSPSAALRFIFRHCGVLLCTPHSSRFARLASEAFYCAVHLGDFLRSHQPCKAWFACGIFAVAGVPTTSASGRPSVPSPEVRRGEGTTLALMLDEIPRGIHADGWREKNQVHNSQVPDLQAYPARQARRENLSRVPESAEPTGKGLTKRGAENMGQERI